MGGRHPPSADDTGKARRPKSLRDLDGPGQAHTGPVGPGPLRSGRSGQARSGQAKSGRPRVRRPGGPRGGRLRWAPRPRCTRREHPDTRTADWNPETGTCGGNPRHRDLRRESRHTEIAALHSLGARVLGRPGAWGPVAAGTRVLGCPAAMLRVRCATPRYGREYADERRPPDRTALRLAARARRERLRLDRRPAYILRSPRLLHRGRRQPHRHRRRLLLLGAGQLRRRVRDRHRQWLAARGNRDRRRHRHQGGPHPDTRASRPQRSRPRPRSRCAASAPTTSTSTTPTSTTRPSRSRKSSPRWTTSSEGKVREIAASNISRARSRASLDFSDRAGLAAYVALQPHYNLVSRDTYEGELETWPARNGLAVLPYFALASGFLTGKYRPGEQVLDGARAGGASALPRHGPRPARPGGPHQRRRGPPGGREQPSPSPGSPPAPPSPPPSPAPAPPNNSHP